MTNKISILIVDDNEADRYLLKRQLKKISYDQTILEASDGDEALNLFKSYDKDKEAYGDRFPPGIVFLDINMPLVGGFEFLEEFNLLRATQEEFRSCIVMMFSSSDRDEEKKKAFSFQFVKDYIVKGQHKPEDLKEKIDSILRGK